MNRLSYISLVEIFSGMLVIAAIGNSFILSLNEAVRLFVIFIGLLYLYLKYEHKIVIKDTQTATFRYGISLLASVLVFFYIQFDPAYAWIDRVSSQERANWFAVSSSAIVVLSFVVFLWRMHSTTHGKGIKGRLSFFASSLIDLDWVVIATIATIALLIIAVGIVFPEASSAMQKSGIEKLGMSLLLYIAVVGVYRVSDLEDEQLVSYRSYHGLKISFIGLLSALFVINVLVVFKFSSAFLDQRKGISLVEDKSYHDAVVLLERTFSKTNSYSEQLNVALGQAYLGLGRYEEAIEQFGFARRAQPRSQTVEKKIGDAYSNTEFWNEAIEAYKAARRENPDPLFIFSPLCLAYLKSGKRERVVELIQEQKRIPRFELNSIGELSEFGIVLAYSGYHDEAQAQFDKALRLDKGSAITLYGRGLLENRRENWVKARNVLEKALFSDSTLTSVFYQLGVAYRHLEQDEDAFSVFEKALAANPGNILVLGNLIYLHRNAGQYGLAEDMMDRMKLSIEPSAWKGPFGSELYWTGSCWYEMELFKGRIEIRVHASGTPASNIWPRMEVSLDGQRIGAVSVVQEDKFVFAAEIKTTGFHKLTISFLNNSTAGEIGDRNLSVKEALIHYLEVY
jgi:tetratricopeptide (TPR) repeat protein